jgi:hypothetical protein
MKEEKMATEMKHKKLLRPSSYVLAKALNEENTIGIQTRTERIQVIKV